VVRANWYCFYCGARGSVENPNDDVPDADVLIAARQFQAEKRADTRAYALRLWDEAEPIGANSMGAVYLKARRVELPPNPDAVMRWHPRCPFGKEGKQPCIVSLATQSVMPPPASTGPTSTRPHTERPSDWAASPEVPSSCGR
jgi:hypothetical protein